MPTRAAEVVEVVITAPDAEWLVTFSRGLVQDRLAACGQHVSPIRSVYRWQDEIHDESEARVALHTRHTLVPAIVARVSAEHPDRVPCVLALQAISGNDEYIDWVIAQTVAESVDP
jgi:periplasmic divalent cation tolerance protein